MKFLPICLTVAFLALSMTIFAQVKKTTSDTTIHKVYTCPMHPEVTTTKPGKCPKCGMTLVEKAIYVCPMHPEITSSTPGKCPKCGMTLVKKADMGMMKN